MDGHFRSNWTVFGGLRFRPFRENTFTRAHGMLSWLDYCCSLAPFVRLSIEGRRHPILRFADQHFSHHNSVEVWLFSFDRDHVLLFELRLRLSTYSMPYPINSIPILLHGHTIAVFLHSVAGSSWHALERRDGSKMMCTTQSILFLYLELVAARLNMWFYCCFRFFFFFFFFWLWLQSAFPSSGWIAATIAS